MTVKRKAIAWIGFLTGVGVVSGSIAIRRTRLDEVGSVSGAVFTRDAQPLKELPVANAAVTVGGGLAQAPASTDSTGLFKIKLKAGVRRGEPVIIIVQHSGYQPLTVAEPAGGELYVIALSRTRAATADATGTGVSQVRVRYTVPAINTVNVGSATKTFEVVNRANVPCGAKGPCSPDGKWQAAIGGGILEAGDDSEFQGVRVSCIAGPCPFSKVEKDDFSSGGKTVRVTVRNWSDTVSYLMEGEVVRDMVNDAVLISYPAIFGQSMDFSLPAAAKGPSIEAEINGMDIVYPLGPALTLPWAGCTVTAIAGGAKLYRCDLRPGYQFR